MKIYKNLDNDSNIKKYNYGDNWFSFSYENEVEWSTFNEKVGQYVINNLKRIANSGRGLDEYLKILDAEIMKKAKRKTN